MYQHDDAKKAHFPRRVTSPWRLSHGQLPGSGDCGEVGPAVGVRLDRRGEERRGAPRVPLLASSSSTPYLRLAERLAQISYGGIAMRDAIDTENQIERRDEVITLIPKIGINAALQPDWK
jgi:hypothetical protein